MVSRCLSILEDLAKIKIRGHKFPEGPSDTFAYLESFLKSHAAAARTPILTKKKKIKITHGESVPPKIETTEKTREVYKGGNTAPQPRERYDPKRKAQFKDTKP